jgi:hypothetical protein
MSVGFALASCTTLREVDCVFCRLPSAENPDDRSLVILVRRDSKYCRHPDRGSDPWNFFRVAGCDGRVGVSNEASREAESS